MFWVSLKLRFNKALAAYDRWQQDMGLMPEQGRCCAPRRQDPPLKRSTRTSFPAEATSKSESE